MLTLSEILQAQNGFKPQEEQSQNTTGGVLNSFQSGLGLADMLKKAGIFGGAGAAGAAVPPVPPVA